jgi:excisionase family DNA binding protein
MERRKRWTSGNWRPKWSWSQAYASRFGIDRDANWFILKLQEEIGELTQAHLMLTGQARTKDRSADEIHATFRAEVADVLCQVLILARHHKIDVVEVIRSKWLVFADDTPSSPPAASASSASLATWEPGIARGSSLEEIREPTTLGALANIAFVTDNAFRCCGRYGEVAEMPSQADSGIRRRDADKELAQRAARRIGEYLTTHPGADPVTIQGELAGDDALVVPREAAVLLAKILGFLANGEGVSVMPDAAELTTQQAAEFLNVSRPYLIKLLESGQIPFRLVGTHRRIRFKDLREYKSRDDLDRRRAANELTDLSQELGLY